MPQHLQRDICHACGTMPARLVKTRHYSLLLMSIPAKQTVYHDMKCLEHVIKVQNKTIRANNPHKLSECPCRVQFARKVNIVKKVFKQDVSPEVGKLVLALYLDNVELACRKARFDMLLTN
eukprot:4277919-Amphidinium_carterae.1